MEGQKLKLPQAVCFYLRDQLLEKRKPIQKAIDNTYAYWNGMFGYYRRELDEAQARRLLKQAATKIRRKAK